MERKSPTKCLVPGCNSNDRGARGLCSGHYNTAMAYVKKGLTTWQKLEKNGKANAPKAKWGNTGASKKFFLS